MSVTAFNRRRREIAALEEAKKLEGVSLNEEASNDIDASETCEQIDYSKLKVDELKEIAKEKEIEGFEEMKKNQLIEVLENNK